MSKYVEKFFLSSQLPGYLFVLSNLCGINDRVWLQCPDSQREFFSAMLVRIGLIVWPDAKAKNSERPRYAISVCENWQDVEHCSRVDAGTTIAFLSSQKISIADFEDRVSAFLPQHPNVILVHEVSCGVMKKTFAVWASRDCGEFEQLKINMLRHTLNEAI